MDNSLHTFIRVLQRAVAGCAACDRCARRFEKLLGTNARVCMQMRAFDHAEIAEAERELRLVGAEGELRCTDGSQSVMRIAHERFTKASTLGTSPEDAPVEVLTVTMWVTSLRKALLCYNKLKEMPLYCLQGRVAVDLLELMRQFGDAILTEQSAERTSVQGMKLSHRRIVMLSFSKFLITDSELLKYMRGGDSSLVHAHVSYDQVSSM